jgi:hypothetical protein
MRIHSQFMRKCASGVIAVAMTAGAHAQTTYTNATYLDPVPHEVREPVTIVQNVGGSDRGVTAYMRLSSPTSTAPKIYTSYTFYFDQWLSPQQLPLPAPYDKSGDPVIVGNTAGRIHVAGTTWRGGSGASDPTYCTLENQISLWTTTNGAASWSSPVAVHANAAGSGYFDDKPAALVSKFSRTPGLVYVAFARFPNLACNSGGQSQILLYRYNPDTGTSYFVGAPATGRNMTDPVLFEDQWQGTLWLAYLDFDSSPYRIVLKKSQDLGASWIDAASINDSGLMDQERSDSVVCDDGDDARNTNQKCVSTKLGMTGRYNPGNGTIGIAWHHRKWNTTRGVEAMFSWYNPAYGVFYNRNVSPNLGSHYSWYPAVDIDSTGKFVLTYYDYNYAASPQELTYGLASSTFDASNATWLSDRGVIFNPPVFSPLPVGTDVVGEYQDLFFWNGYFNAVTVYPKDGFKDIFHVRFPQ